MRMYDGINKIADPTGKSVCVSAFHPFPFLPLVDNAHGYRPDHTQGLDFAPFAVHTWEYTELPNVAVGMCLLNSPLERFNTISIGSII